MLALVAPLLAAAVSLPDARTFWRVDEVVTAQPTQTQLAARLVATGRHIAVYQEEGYSFSALGLEDEKRQVAQLVAAFDDLIFPGQTSVFGVPPDRDGNGVVLLLITDLGLRASHFWPFDFLDDGHARQLGLRSNEGEVLFLSFLYQGNRGDENLRAAARAFHQLLHHARKPGDTDWSRLFAQHATFALGMAPDRFLWGDRDPQVPQPSADQPLDPDGWGSLFVQYLVDQWGPEILTQITEAPGIGLAGFEDVLATRGARRSAADSLADFSMARWLLDPMLQEGRFSLAAVTPPRPAAIHLVASRPASSSLSIGVGGAAYLLLQGDGQRPLPLTLQGDPHLHWQVRAVLLRAHGPDVELPLTFNEQAVATLELQALEPTESVVLAVTPLPRDSAGRDRAQVNLQWGVGWVPHPPTDLATPRLSELAAKALPDGGTVARGRLQETLAVLAGASPAPGSGRLIASRYAWSPAVEDVLLTLEEKANFRRLPVQRLPFSAPWGDGQAQQWQNLVIELPGSDPRRWPVVIAAHWDGARSDPEHSYQRALNVDSNATGVAVALEVAAAVAQTNRRAPVLVAFLAGGRHGAAGASALLDHLENRAAIWIELDGVGVPEGRTRNIPIRLDGLDENSLLGTTVVRAFRQAGLAPRPGGQVISPHSGVALAASRGVPSVLIRSRDVAATAGEIDVPPEAELQRVAPDLLVLLTKILADLAVQLAGPA